MESSMASTMDGESVANISSCDASCSSTFSGLDVYDNPTRPYRLGTQHPKNKIALPSHSHTVLTNNQEMFAPDDKTEKEQLQEIQMLEAAISDSLPEAVNSPTLSETNTTKPKGASLCKKQFVDSLMAPCTKPGYVTCRICRWQVWGPNGRYHIDSCRVLLFWRVQQSEQKVLSCVNGIDIHRRFFAKPKALTKRDAKIAGFVMSHTVLKSDPFKAPTLAQKRRGGFTGRKGYTRCTFCNEELFAPNTRRHISVCPKWKKW